MDSDYDIVHTAMEIPTFARALNAEPKSQLFLKENQDSQPRLLVSTAEKNGSVISNFKSSWNHYYIEDNSSSDENISQTTVFDSESCRLDDLAEYVQMLAAKQARCNANIKKLEQSTRNFASIAIPAFVIILLILFLFLVDVKPKKAF
ncbi:Coiled-coil domain-containing protein 167 [Caenorhabditis elegans]|uniref:Coiled-coil domain-containing protein 167 n=1 Tax=Caenorhabditis elegans TaxID=6239 RepID=Q17986_CAEEL|nr:Coiled-coil domain-containing protein 167 [Caenorhabditis elegans]CCD64518.1 Coiled-coil domain-containing protein 167 [Caenorhabditis elegans]|eukprot:NP_508334.2 Uncharacterized protein CELE_C14E2.5 [Caenorhabditis elegans]